MLTEERVREIFSLYLPEDVQLEFVEHDRYITESMQIPYVQEQMRVGIYNDVNIWTDFLSVAKAYALLKLVEVDMTLIHNQTAALTDELAEGLVHWTAAHEAHHFVLPHPGTSDIAAHSHAEIECNDMVAAMYPAVEELMGEVELSSIVYQRVYARIQLLQEARANQL